jgi:predicted ATPase
MNIEIRELGALKCAEFTINELTIISGANNSGKTYATYALYGYLKLWRQFFTFKPVIEGLVEDLNFLGAAELSVDALAKQFDRLEKKACDYYVSNLHRILAGNEKFLTDVHFRLTSKPFENFRSEPFEHTATRANTSLFRISYDGGSSPIRITLLTELSKLQNASETTRLAIDFLNETLKEQVLGKVYPDIFIASAERTGATIFQKELDIARNRLLEHMGENASGNLDPFKALLKASTDYPLPVRDDINFIRSIESLAKEEGALVKANSGLLDDFHDIIGGEYKIVKNQGVFFVPHSKKTSRLSMGESSSAVRSLLNIGSYLRHKAKAGDLLVIDEPELNLHPLNQRKIARLVARLVNSGVKVFLTTHSDYIIKELNTLIMLSPREGHLERVRAEEKYREDELLSPDKISVYHAQLGDCKYGEMSRAVKGMTLVPADINVQQGIEITSFDDQIEQMDLIQSKILYTND